MLGCTHYPFVSEAISKILGPEVELLDGGDGTARETLRRLEAAGLCRETGEGSLLLTASGDEGHFRQLAEALLR